MVQPHIDIEEAGERKRPADPEAWGGAWRLLFWSCGLVMAANVFLWYWDYLFMYTAISGFPN